MKRYSYFYTPLKLWGRVEAYDIYQAFDAVRGMHPTGGLCVYAPTD